MTRSDLAEKLNVSVLKVSRWEDNEEEPEEEIVKQLEAIFGSISNTNEETNSIEPKGEAIEPTLEESIEEETKEEIFEEPIETKTETILEPKVEPKRVYNICAKCSKRITDKSDLALITRTIIVDGAPKATIEYVCKACKEDYENRMANQAKVVPNEKTIVQENTLIALRIHSIIWFLVNLTVFSCIGISMITSDSVSYGYGIVFIAIGLVLGTFVGNVILQNNTVASIYYYGYDYLKETYENYPHVSKWIDRQKSNANGFMRDIACFAYTITLLAALFVNIFIGIVLYPISIAKNVKQAKL